MRERRCIKCGSELGKACFPSVLARDVIRAEKDEIKYTQIREHCGKCVMYLIAYAYGGPRSYEETQAYLLSIPEVP